MIRDPLRVYLAARYSRREELCSYREQLQELGLVVTSRWLDGSHQVDADGKFIGDHGEAAVESGTDPVAAHFANDDLADIDDCEILVAFTEAPRIPSTNRGGRHVELGYALASRKIIIVVGHRENVFCWLPPHFCETWEQALAILVDENASIESAGLA